MEENTIEVDFLNYVTSLSLQAMIFLGEVPNPVNQQMVKNMKQAKLLIDTLIMLQEKTKGNLTQSEADLINKSVTELKQKYVEHLQKGA